MRVARMDGGSEDSIRVSWGVARITSRQTERTAICTKAGIDCTFNGCFLGFSGFGHFVYVFRVGV